MRQEKEMSIEWFYFLRSVEPPELARNVVPVFESVESEIASPKSKLNSDAVLRKVRLGLESLGFRVEAGKKNVDKIPIPVLFGKNGKPVKSFNADAFHERDGFVLEVEAGMAVANYHYLKDVIQASLMVNVKHLGIAVRKVWEAVGSPTVISTPSSGSSKRGRQAAAFSCRLKEYLLLATANSLDTPSRLAASLAGLLRGTAGRERKLKVKGQRLEVKEKELCLLRYLFTLLTVSC